MRKAVVALREWQLRNANLIASDDVLRKAESDPLTLLRPKGLPNYPREAQTNDDKRILFFSKVLAGLEFGLTPLTATKKLSHWRCENYWKTVGINYVASFKTGLPVYPEAQAINLWDTSIEFHDSRQRVEVVAEHYAVADSLEKVEQWYIESLGVEFKGKSSRKHLGVEFKRKSSGDQGYIVHRRLSIGPCDEAFIGDENDLVWVVAIKRKMVRIEIDLARVGKAENRKLYRKGEQR
jgi:hypothetical protein